MDNHIFHVTKENGRYIIRDSDGANYGSYDTKAQAEENAELWKRYYEAPMVF